MASKKRAASRAANKTSLSKKRVVLPPLARDQHELVIITGISGAGKLSALKTFEDLGYYAVDNLPVGLLLNFADLVRDSAEIERAALVVDIREGARLDKLPQLLQSLRGSLKTTVLFLEANEDALLRRYSETRRPHPLGRETSVKASLRSERRRLQPVRAIADLVVDTSKFNVHELRNLLTERFQSAEREQNILISCVSFGFRQGVPEDADLMFDVRFLPNPHFIPKFRPFTGRHPAGGALHSLVPADQGVHRAHFGTAGVPDSALHPRGQELPHHRVWLHRRQAPLGADRRRGQEAAGQGGLQREGGPSRLAGGGVGRDIRRITSAEFPLTRNPRVNGTSDRRSALLDGDEDRHAVAEASTGSRDRHSAVQRSGGRAAAAAAAATTSAGNHSQHDAQQQEAEQAVAPAFAAQAAPGFHGEYHAQGEDERCVGADPRCENGSGAPRSIPLRVAALMVRVEVPLPPVTVDGARLHVVEPSVVVTVHVRATSEVKPPTGATVMVALPLGPLDNTSEPTEEATVKSGLVPFTVIAMGTR